MLRKSKEKTISISNLPSTTYSRSFTNNLPTITNIKTDNTDKNESKKLFNSACKIIGLFDLNKNEWENLKKTNKDISEDFILKKIEERLAAKQEGNYKLADQIRDELTALGIEIEDSPQGTKWRKT